MANKILTHRFENGLSIFGEQVEQASAAAFSLLVPMGVVHDPADKLGSTSVLLEMMQKGAGAWDSRGLSQEYENLGAQLLHHVGTETSHFRSAVLGENLPKLLRITAEVILNPHLPETELDNVRALGLQNLMAIEDEPSVKANIELSKEFYPDPFGRYSLGTIEGVKNITRDSLKAHYQKYIVPEKTIIGVAGKFDWEQVVSTLTESFADWKGSASVVERQKLREENHYQHLEKETSQVQIALAYPSVSYGHPDYYVAKVATGVLSGGMSGRLFIEVREKRGLVYRVAANHSAMPGFGGVFAFAGTTPENAQQTLDVILVELRKMKEGVKEEELARAKADLKSRLVMQGEITAIRAAGLLADWWNLGRIRPLEEIKQGIDQVSNQDIIRHANDFPIRAVTLVSLGPKKISLEVA